MDALTVSGVRQMTVRTLAGGQGPDGEELVLVSMADAEGKCAVQVWAAVSESPKVGESFVVDVFSLGAYPDVGVGDDG